MQHLTVDLRKAFDAGIGTYIRNVVPRVLARLPPTIQVAALVPHDQQDRYGWLSTDQVVLIPMRAHPLGIGEQFELPFLLPSGTVFWATSLAHPLWLRGPLFATVHDVAQLALQRAEGVPAHVALASRALLSNLRHRASALVAVSTFTRDEFVRLVGSPTRGRLSITPLGVEDVWYETTSARAASNTPYFVCVGSVRPHKNVARLLDAFVEVAAHMPHELVIAGESRKPYMHESWLKGLPDAVRERIRFTGRLDDVDLRGLVAGADALVFPSLYEGFGLPAIEAMAAGCPVLASRAGSLPEVCGLAAAGMFDPRSVKQIGQALLEHAFRTAAERQAIVDQGAAHARGFVWSRTAELTAQALHRAFVAPECP